MTTAYSDEGPSLQILNCHMQSMIDPRQPISGSGSYTKSIASEIPLDVLEVIFKSLTPQDLFTCCRVNKAVHLLAFEALYRDLRPTRRNVMTLCLKLCNDPNLARRARSFVIYDLTVEMYLGIIQDTLLLLPRLHTLVLFIGQLSSWILPRQKPCPFLLQTFACSFFYDKDVASFLEGQPDIRHLTVSGPTNPMLLRAITPRLVPNLTSIYAPLSVVEAMAPERPVCFVTTFCTTDAPNPPSISCLSRSTSPTGVQRLTLNFVYLQSVGCEQLARASIQLQCHSKEQRIFRN